MPQADRIESKVETSQESASASHLSSSVYSDMMQKSPSTVAAGMKQADQCSNPHDASLRGILPTLEPFQGSSGNGDTKAGGGYPSGGAPADSGKISPTHAAQASDKPLK